MGCNCNIDNDFVNVSTTNTNNILGGENYSNSFNNCDYNPRHYPEQPLLKFLASKKPRKNLEEAKLMILTKQPRLELGQPAVVQYYDASVGDASYYEKPIRLLFCIGAAKNDQAIMFQITDTGGGGSVPEDLVQRVINLENQMAEVYTDISALIEKDIQQDVSINLALSDSSIAKQIANEAKQDASTAKQVALDVSGKVSNYDVSINIAISTANESKQIAEDVSGRVGTFDSRITEAQVKAAQAQTDASIAKQIAEDVSVKVVRYDTSINLAIDTANTAKQDSSIAKQTAIDASNRVSDDNIGEIVQRLLDLGYITVNDASTANYAEDSSTANYATNATNADRASYATYATDCANAAHATWADRVGSAEDASKAEGMVWYDVE